MTRKDILVGCFENAFECDMEYVGLLVQSPNDILEMIIIPNEFILDKLEYYEKAYDDDLCLKTCKEVKIINFTCADSLDDIETDFLR